MKKPEKKYIPRHWKEKDCSIVNELITYNECCGDWEKWLSRERFRAILCEYVPTIAEDSGMAEWSQGELDKVYDDLILGKGVWTKIDWNKE